MWNDETGQVMSGPAAPGPVLAGQECDGAEGGQQNAEPQTDQERDVWSHRLVRGVPHDWDLLHFDAKYETARNPAEWLWGPGTGRDAMAWLAREQPPDDEVDLLDRIFLLRYHVPLLYLPRNPDLAASVTDDKKPGTWYLIKADSPVIFIVRWRGIFGAIWPGARPVVACATVT
jgi:hypothetical protein